MIDGITVRSLLDFVNGKEIIHQTYLLHEEGKTVLPHSIFLRPDSRNRIIGLPAYIGGEVNVSGIKWVASYPDNYLFGKARASSMIILNDAQTGYPICCIDGSFINLFRTSCSAFLVAEKLSNINNKISVGIVGTGAIAGCFIDCLNFFGTVPAQNIFVFDKNKEQVEKFVQEKCLDCSSKTKSAEELILKSDIILLATTSSQPHIFNKDLFTHKPLVLNISLRDLYADIILSANNIVDDLDHVNRENTSIHHAYKKTGVLNFINGNVAQLLKTGVVVDNDKPTVFSPFGLGILDVAIGKYIYDLATEQNKGTVINNFFN